MEAVLAPLSGRALAIVACVVAAFLLGALTARGDASAFKGEIERLTDEAEYRDDVINDLIVEIDDLRKEAGK